MSEPTSKASSPAAAAPSIEGEHTSDTPATWGEVLGIQERVDKHPYGMLAAAFGVGYVLGGGLLTPTTARVVGLAAKLATVPVVRDTLLDLAEAAVDGLLESTGPGAGSGGVPPPAGPTA